MKAKKNLCRASAIAFFSIIILSGINISLRAEEQMEGRGAEAFPYPWKNFSFIQPRFDRVNYDGDGYMNNYVFRGVQVFNNSWHMRLDLPLANTNLSGENVFGLSDIAVRLMHSTEIYKQFYLSYGAEFVFPTATDEMLGSGKWQAHPEIAGIYFLGQPNHVIGSAILGVGYQFDYAGAGDRAHISSFHIAPNIDYWGKKWYIGYYATWKYNLKNKVFDLPLDIEAGYTFYPEWTIAAEFIQPLVNTKKVGYDNEVEVKIRYMIP